MLVVHVQNDGIRVPRNRTYADGTSDRWWAFADGSPPHQIVVAAIEQLRRRIIENQGVLTTCNQRYRAISARRRAGAIGFEELFLNPEPRVIVCHSQTTAYWGVTNGNYIAVTDLCLRRAGNPSPVDATAATILHELAHVVGATGNTTGRGHYIAESVLPPCGYGHCFQRGGGG